MNNIVKLIFLVLCMMVILTACLIRDASNFGEMEVIANGKTVKPLSYPIWKK